MIFVQDPDPKTRFVDDYDFVFTNEVVKSITIDKEAGDVIEYPTPDSALIRQVARIDEDNMMTVPPENTTIYLKNILYVVHRIREVTNLTNSQKEQWQKTLQETSKTIQ